MLLSLALVTLAQAPADFPHVVMGRPGGRMTVYTPDPQKGFYRGSRFAQNSVIKDLEVGGFKLYGPWKDTHDPANNDDITGPAEEFSMFDPLAYAEAKPGEPFVKIGVGELVKGKDEKYQFWGKYELADGGQWSTATTRDGPPSRLISTHTLNSRRTGYGYVYSKAITFRPGPNGGVELTLVYTLKNSGTKPIQTDVYNHNFFNADGRPVGPQYKIEFPQPVKPASESKFDSVAKFDGGTYTFARVLAKGQSPFGLLTDAAGKPMQHAFTQRYTNDAGKSVAVKVTSETPVTKFQTWSVTPCMCPEPFSAVSVQPGQTQQWQTRYEVRAE